MEIKKENTQTFDFNRLENLRESEIPLSTERKINFTLETPSMSLNINYKDKEECVMSKGLLFSGAPVKFYRCPLCSYTTEGERVCEYCFLNCHSGHGDIHDLEPSFYTLNDNFCSCAKNKHSLSHFKKKLFKKTISDHCFFINIQQILRLNSYIKVEEKTYCLGCYYYCLKNNKNKYDIVDGQISSCFCNNCLNLPKSKPIEVLYEIICDENNTCDLSGAFYNLITNPEMNKMFILPLIMLFNSLSIVDYPKTSIIDNTIKSNEINLKVLKALIKKFNYDDVMIINKLSDIIISDVISQTDSKTYQHANSILYSPFPKFINLLEIKENSPYIISIKYYALFFFRKLFILPATGIKKNYSITNKVKIITVFHRLYCRMTKDEFFDNLLPYDCDEDLFNKIINHLTMRTTLFRNKETFLYIKENLKWYLLILSIEYPTNEERDNYIKTIISKIILILDNIKENKIFEKDENKTYIEGISYYIQKIVLAIILSLNDKVFKEYIMDRINGIPLDIEKEKKKRKFFFCKDGVLKNEFSEILKILLFFSNTGNTKISSKIYKLLLRTEDDYITLLEHFSGTHGGNKQQISTKIYNIFMHEFYDEKNNLSEISNLIESSKEAKIQYYRNCDFKAFSESFNNNLEEILIEIEKYRNYIDDLDNTSIFKFNNKSLQQVNLIKSGFFNDLLSIYDFYKKAFILDKKIHKSGKKDYKDVEEKIFNISVAFANNALIFPIFLTKKFLKIIVKYDKIHKKYFLGTGEIKFYCKLLKEIAPLKLNNDYTYLVNVALNVIFDDDYEKMISLFKLLIYIMKLNCSETSKEICHLICNYLESNNYQKYFPKYSEGDEYNEEEVEVFKPLEKNKIQLLLFILKIINLLDNYYYCIFVKTFPIDSVEQIIKGYRKELQNCTEEETIVFYEKIIRTFSYSYAKFYIITPFVVYIDTFKNKEYDKYIESGYPIIFEKEGLHNLVRKPIIKFDLGEEFDNINYFINKNIEPIVNFDFWRLSPEVKTRVNEKIQLETLFEFITKKDNFINAWKNKQIYIASKETNGIYYKKHTEILNVLIENMEMGGIQLKYLKNEPKALFKHFEKVILKPTCYMIYHCLYYNEINSNQKYIIYKILILFLKCYKEFLQLIIDKIMDFAKENMYKKFNGSKTMSSKNFNLNRQYKIIKPNTLSINENEKKLELLIQDFFIIEEYQQDIKIYLLNTRDCVDIDIDLIGKNPLDTILLLKKFTKYLVKLKKIKFTKINKDNEQIFLYFINSEENKVVQENSEELKERNEFLNHMSSFIQIYKELKSDKSQNLLFESISDSSPTGKDILYGLFNDILNKCLYQNNNKIYNHPYYLRDEYLNNFESFNEIIIENPSLFQEFLIEEDKKYIENKKIENTLKKKDEIIEEQEEDSEQQELDGSIDDDEILLHNISYSIINEVISQLKILYQYVIIDYHKFLSKEEPYSVKCFNNLIEFLRLLCENHNQIYQLLLSKYPIDIIKNEDELNQLYGITLPQLLFQIPPLSQECIEFSDSKSKYISYLKEHNDNFFNSIINKVTDFLIEMIQGSKSSLILKTTNLYFLFYLIMGDIILDNDINKNINYLSQFFRFMVCFVEENAIDVEDKNDVINLFNSRKLVFYLADCVKMLYQSLPQKPELKETEKKKSFHKILHEEFLLNTNFFMNNNQYFNISCYVCKFLNFAASFGNVKIAKLLNEFEGVKNEEKLDQKALWRRESTLFFSKLLRKVYINQSFTYILPNEEKEINSDYSVFEDMIDIRDDGSNEEFETKHNKDEKSDLSLNIRTTTYIGTFGSKNSTIADVKIKESSNRTNENRNTPSITTIFICHPDVLLLDKEDFIDFENFAPYDSQQGKLIYLLQYIPTLIEKIDYKKTILKKKSKFYEVLYNIDNFKILQISAILVLIINFLLLISVYYDMKTFFVNKMIIERHSTLIFTIQIMHLIFLFLVFYNWFFFKLFFLRQIKRQYKINRIELIKTFLFKDVNLSLLIWNFIWGIIGAFTPTFHFAYSFQLFSIFGCFETMSTVFTSVQMRGKQFMGAGLLILIFSLFFTGIKFYYFCDPTNEECEKFSNCYLSMITLGIRSGKGLDLSMKSINTKGYFSEFLIEWLFFFVIILVMLNIINGIIVDTFQEQREKNNIRNDAKLNRCFICHHERQYIEKNGFNSSVHMYNNHSYRNYFDYLISIQKQNKLDLNSLDFEIWKKMEMEKTDFFPKNL